MKRILESVQWGLLLAILLMLVFVMIFAPRGKPSQVSGLDMENAPAGATILQHLDGTQFWRIELRRGECFWYLNKRRCLPK